MRDIKPILHSMGLLDSEIKVYLASFELGPNTAIDLAKKTKLSRQAVYVAIDTLTRHGLMTWVMQGKKRLYMAEPPQKLLSFAQSRAREMQQQVKDLENTLPELELQMGGERPVVRIYEGKEGIKAIIQDLNEAKLKEAYEITDVEAMYKVLSAEDLNDLKETAKNNKTQVSGFYSRSQRPEGLTPHQHLLEGANKDFRANIGIYGNRVAMVTFEGKLYSTLIESEALAKTMRILFKLALKGAGDK